MNNLPDNCQSPTDKSLPWNVKICDECGADKDEARGCFVCDPNYHEEDEI